MRLVKRNNIFAKIFLHFTTIGTQIHLRKFERLERNNIFVNTNRAIILMKNVIILKESSFNDLN